MGYDGNRGFDQERYSVFLKMDAKKVRAELSFCSGLQKGRNASLPSWAALVVWLGLFAPSCAMAVPCDGNAAKGETPDKERLVLQERTPIQENAALLHVSDLMSQVELLEEQKKIAKLRLELAELEEKARLHRGMGEKKAESDFLQVLDEEKRLPGWMKNCIAQEIGRVLAEKGKNSAERQAEEKGKEEREKRKKRELSFWPRVHAIEQGRGAMTALLRYPSGLLVGVRAGSKIGSLSVVAITRDGVCVHEGGKDRLLPFE